MRPLAPTWVSLPVSSSMWARVTPTRNPSGSSSHPPDVERQVVLADLVVLGLVRVEVVLPGEHRRPDLAVQGRADPHGQLDGLLVEHRQRPRADPRQVGQMLTFGSSPNALRHPQKSFVVGGQLAVHLEPDDHLPALAHDRQLRSARRPRPPCATRNSRASCSAGASTCTPTGSPSSPVPKGTETRRVAREVGRDGADVVHVHRHRVVHLGPEVEGGRRRGRAEQDVERLVGPVERLHHQRADPLRLGVVGVVVAGGQGVGARA